MEATFVRAFVIMLALSGFGASAVNARNSNTGKKPVASSQALGGPALCAPSDPTYCGMD